MISLCSCDSSKVGNNYDIESRFTSLNITYEISLSTFEVVIDNETDLVYLSSYDNYALCPLMKNNNTQYAKEEFLKEYQNEINKNK
jgi:hypothetical protein